MSIEPAWILLEYWVLASLPALRMPPGRTKKMIFGEFWLFSAIFGLQNHIFFALFFYIKIGMHFSCQNHQKMTILDSKIDPNSQFWDLFFTSIFQPRFQHYFLKIFSKDSKGRPSIRMVKIDMKRMSDFFATCVRPSKKWSKNDTKNVWKSSQNWEKNAFKIWCVKII